MSKSTRIWVCPTCTQRLGFQEGVLHSYRKCDKCHKTKVCTLVEPTEAFIRYKGRKISSAHNDDEETIRYRCPECEAVIDHLAYNEDMYEYGSCDIDGENCEADGSDYCGDGRRYECPECNTELNPEDVIRENNAENDEADTTGPNSEDPGEEVTKT